MARHSYQPSVECARAHVAAVGSLAKLVLEQVNSPQPVCELRVGDRFFRLGLTELRAEVGGYDGPVECKLGFYVIGEVEAGRVPPPPPARPAGTRRASRHLEFTPPEGDGSHD